jgi:pilus assembly protein Flp/PilA
MCYLAVRMRRVARLAHPAQKEVITAVLLTLITNARSFTTREDEDGQGLAEYALILALIAIVAIVALIFLGGQISDKLSTIGDTL